MSSGIALATAVVAGAHNPVAIVLDPALGYLDPLTGAKSDEAAPSYVGATFTAEVYIPGVGGAVVTIPPAGGWDFAVTIPAAVDTDAVTSELTPPVSGGHPFGGYAFTSPPTVARSGYRVRVWATLAGATYAIPCADVEVTVLSRDGRM